MSHDTYDRLAPVAAGVGLVAAGLALYSYKPPLLALPEAKPIDDDSNPNFAIATAHDMRDGIASVMPENLATTISRAFLITGLALLVVRILDEITGRYR